MVVVVVVVVLVLVVLVVVVVVVLLLLLLVLLSITRGAPPLPRRAAQAIDAQAQTSKGNAAVSSTMAQGYAVCDHARRATPLSPGSL